MTDLFSVVVIGNLVVLLYVVWILGQVKEALAIIFISIDELSKGNPVLVSVDDKNNLQISWPNRDNGEDDDYDNG